MIIKLQNLRFSEGQVISEYAMMFSIIIAAIIAMNFYMKRGYQAGVMGAVNYTLTSPLFNTSQFEPPYAYSSSEAIRDSRLDEDWDMGTQIDYDARVTDIEYGYMNITNETKHRRP